MLDSHVFPVLRSLQSRMPFIRPLKFGLYNAATRSLGWHIEPEFKLLGRMAPITLAVDIGGNWGQSIWALRRIAKPSRIISFEPDAYLANRLRRTFANDPSVCIYACAIAERPGSFPLYTPKYRNFIYDGLASLNREEAEGWLTKRMAAFDPAQLSIMEQTVEVKTLDSFDLVPDVVKIDVQGAEYQAVKGGIETFRRATPVTIVESPSPALVELFSTLGMSAYAFVRGALKQDWKNSTNVLFLSPQRRRELKL